VNSTSPSFRFRYGSAARLYGSAAWLAAGIAFTLVLGAGCGHNIGDGCSINTDCSPNNDRECDMSQPGGYCTIEGCDQSSCPSDSACVRFFPEKFLSQPCNPACNLLDHPTISNDASMPTQCPDKMPLACPDDGSVSPPQCVDCKNALLCAADELCLPSGLCVPRADEQRLCVRTCSSNSDCRGGYECRVGGTLGSLPLLSDPCANVSFCAPLVSSP
jgi:hypothetical protein